MVPAAGCREEDTWWGTTGC